MKTQIKQWGDSKVIILNPEFVKYKQLQIGDWVDIAHIKKINKGGQENDTETQTDVE